MNVELLQKVKQHILEEPERLLMRNWVVRREHETDEHLDDNRQLAPFPKCGTVGCIAGWAVLLHDGHEPEGLYIEDRAVEVLGIPWDISDQLFHVNCWDYLMQSQELFFLQYWGHEPSHLYYAAKTAEERATLAAQQIDRFIEKYATHG